jgi:hypothetical protein
MRFIKGLTIIVSFLKSSKAIATACAITMLSGLTIIPARAQNLIVNGGAEVFTGGPNAVADFDGWTRTGNVFHNFYASFPVTPVGSTPFPSFGNSYFLGGNEASTSLTQVVDLSGFTSIIDSGSAIYNLSAWLGGRAQEVDVDTSQIEVVFRNASSAPLGTVTLIGPDFAELTANGSSNILSIMLQRDALGAIPVGTRDAKFTLGFTRRSGTVSNGTADNLSFTVSVAAPEPTSVSLFLITLMGGIAVRRRSLK